MTYFCRKKPSSQQNVKKRTHTQTYPFFFSFFSSLSPLNTGGIGCRHGDLGKGGEGAARAEYTMDGYFRVRFLLKKKKCWKALYDTGGKAIEGNRREGPRDFLLVCTVLVYI